jgi:hypothetical protein
MFCEHFPYDVDRRIGAPSDLAERRPGGHELMHDAGMGCSALENVALNPGPKEIRTICDGLVADVLTAEELATHVVEHGDQVRR